MTQADTASEAAGPAQDHPMVQRVREWIGPACRQIDTGGQHNPRRAWYRVEPDDVPATVARLFSEHGARLVTVTGIDVRDGTELQYHMAFDPEHFVATLRVLLPRTRAEMPSITPILPAAEFIEREIHDLLGVGFAGHPRLERLILADDWPEGAYPLRRDFRDQWSEKLRIKKPTEGP